MKNNLEAALISIANYLSHQNIQYMVIGGLANAVWGQPRATLDVDITVWLSNDLLTKTISSLETNFKILVNNPESFIQETRVLPLQTLSGIRIDLIFGILPFEEQAIKRSVTKEISNFRIQFCAPEDLILYKIISDRSKDLNDVQHILLHQKASLDYQYLEPRIKELADALCKPDIWNNWEMWKNK